MKVVSRLLALVMVLGTFTACGKSENEKNKDLVNSMKVRLNQGNKDIQKGDAEWFKIMSATSSTQVEKMTAEQLSLLAKAVKEARRHYGNANANFNSILTDDSKNKGVDTMGNLPQVVASLNIRLKELKVLAERIEKAQANPKVPVQKSKAVEYSI